jgi:flotillin
MFGYRVPAPDEAMLISGGKGAGGAPFKVVVGHGSYVMPWFRRVRFLTLSMQEATVSEQCTTTQGLAANIEAVIAFKVPPDDPSVIAAGQRFLGDQRQMPQLTGQIFAGHLRSIVGALTMEEIIQQRQKLAEQVLDASKEEMSRIGLLVDSFQITHADDAGAGYIKAMAAPHNAAIQQAAQIAQSQANQRSAEAEQESQRNQAQYARDTKVTQAKYQAEVDSENQKAAQAGPLARAQAEQAVLEQQKALALRQAELTEAQLQSTVVKPAQAEADRVKIAAQAEADRTTIQADADAHKMEVQAASLAAEGRVTIDRMLIDKLPDLVSAAAQGLQGANLTILNGTEGVDQMMTTVMGQGLGFFEFLRRSIANQSANADGQSALTR